MNENIIAWNVTNWVTVVLMAAVAFFLLGTFLKWKQGKSSPGSSAAPVAATQEP